MATATPSQVSSTSHRTASARRAMSRAAFQRTLASAKRTMVFSEIALLAIDSFRANKVRFALTALGMVIGSASLILVVTIGLTGKQYIMKLHPGHRHQHGRAGVFGRRHRERVKRVPQ